MQVLKIQTNPYYNFKNTPKNKAEFSPFFKNKTDTVSFCSNIPKEIVAFKNPEDERICQQLIKKLYGEEYKILPEKRSSSISRFEISINGFHDIGTGAVFYDDENKIKYISIQEFVPMGFFMEEGGVKVYSPDGKLIKSISKEQAHSINAYSGEMARTLNSILRNHPENTYFKEHVKILDSMFSDPMCFDVLEEDTKFYRGVKRNECNAPYFKINLGEPFLEKGYLSTTTNKKLIEHFGNCFFEIIAAKGTPYVNLTPLIGNSKYFTKEDEILFARNTLLLPTEFNPETNTYKMLLLPKN